MSHDKQSAASVAAYGTGAADSAWVVCHPHGAAAAPRGHAWIGEAPDIRVTFDGVLFEPDELATRIGLPADQATNPASIALAAYRELGDDWLKRLSGHYAIVVQDRRHQSLTAVRDAMGMHPLFFCDTGRSLFLSASINALFDMPDVPRTLNRVALAEHLLHRWSDASETYFEAVRRVPPGHVLDVRNGVTRLRRYWDPEKNGSVEWLRDAELEQFDFFLERAVVRCLARGRTSIFLSGGFDSNSIAAVAVDSAKKLGHPTPVALSLGFPDPACNEEPIQRGVAQLLGMPQDLVSFSELVGGRPLLELAEELAADWPYPMMNLWNPPYRRLAERGRAKGCRVVLTGSGGDEWLTVSPYLAADLIRRGDVGGAMRFIALQRRSYRLSTPQAIRNTVWTFGGRPLAGMVIDRMAPRYWRARRRRKLIASTPSWVAPDPSLRSHVDHRAERILRPPQPKAGGFYAMDGRTALDHPLTSIEMEEHFEMGRRLGMSILHPYWDQNLVELLYRTPPYQLMKGGRSKGLVRDTVARRFPTLGFGRQRKVHATNFYWTTLQKEGPKVWARMGGAAALAELGVVDPGALAKNLEQLFAGHRRRESYRIWSVLNLESWVRTQIQGRNEKGRRT